LAYVRISKGAYLKKITTALKNQSVAVGKEMEGSSPPSVFIGSWNYPRVFAGPMVAPVHGDTAIMDMPESWISGNKSQEEIIGYRLNLVRGKHQVNVTDLDTRFVEKLQGIEISSRCEQCTRLFVVKGGYCEVPWFKLWFPKIRKVKVKNRMRLWSTYLRDIHL
jgi:hypothetical protein